MRKVKLHQITPLVIISIILTASILAAHCCYGFIDTIYWMVAAILSLTLACLSKRRGLQISLIYLCTFCLGGMLTSHDMDQTYETPQVVEYEELSSLDRTILTADSFRQKMEQHLKSLHIKDQDFAVISAMTLGDKQALDQETKETYSISGASHVLAVSGLHIGIIFQMFILMMGGRKRSKVTIALSLVAIWSYVILIGMPASAIRSAFMISTYSFALLMNRNKLSVNNLAFAYTTMLLIHPLYLYDISFQMSFIAVLSILLFFPPLFSALHAKRRCSRWIGSLFCVSLAAQIGTMPLIIYYFGRISCYSLLTSFIAIPAATLILYLSAIILLLTPLSLLPSISFLATPLMQWTSRCLLDITQAMNTALKLTTMLPGASIEGIRINIPQLCLIYTSVVVGYILIQTLHRFHFLGSRRHRLSCRKDYTLQASRTSPSGLYQGLDLRTPSS